jgi:tetratricopeptide (TPR) repeat protein
MYVKARLVCQHTEQRFIGKPMFFYCASLLSAVLAMKTKEIAFTLPVMIALFEFLFLKGNMKKRIAYLVPFLLTLAIIPMGLLAGDSEDGNLTGDFSEATRLHTTISRFDYLLTEVRVVMTYLRLILLPIKQNLDYDYPVFQSFINHEVFFSFLFTTALTGLGVFFLLRSRTAPALFRLAACGIFWFFITLSVESSLVPILDVIYEHRTYLPNVGAFSVLVTGMVLIGNKIQHETLKSAGITLLVFLPLILGVSTYSRNTVWKTEISLWEDVVNKSPRKIRGHNNLANAYKANGLDDKAIEHYHRALDLEPNPFYQMPQYFYGEIHYNLGVTYASKNLIDQSIEHYQQALKLKPDNIDAYNNLGIAYYLKGLTAQAIEYYREALRRKPDYINAYLNLGLAYYDEGMTDEALQHYRIFLKYRPNNVEAHYNMGIAYETKNLPDKAREHYQTVLRLDPAHRDAERKLRRVRTKK